MEPDVAVGSMLWFQEQIGNIVGITVILVTKHIMQWLALIGFLVWFPSNIADIGVILVTEPWTMAGHACLSDSITDLVVTLSSELIAW